MGINWGLDMSKMSYLHITPFVCSKNLVQEVTSLIMQVF